MFTSQIQARAPGRTFAVDAFKQYAYGIEDVFAILSQKYTTEPREQKESRANPTRQAPVPASTPASASDTTNPTGRVPAPAPTPDKKTSTPASDTTELREGEAEYLVEELLREHESQTPKQRPNRSARQAPAPAPATATSPAPAFAPEASYQPSEEVVNIIKQRIIKSLPIGTSPVEPTVAQNTEVKKSRQNQYLSNPVYTYQWYILLTLLEIDQNEHKDIAKYYLSSSVSVSEFFDEFKISPETIEAYRRAYHLFRLLSERIEIKAKSSIAIACYLVKYNLNIYKDLNKLKNVFPKDIKKIEKFVNSNEETILKNEWYDLFPDIQEGLKKIIARYLNDKYNYKNKFLTAHNTKEELVAALKEIVDKPVAKQIAQHIMTKFPYYFNIKEEEQQEAYNEETLNRFLQIKLNFPNIFRKEDYDTQSYNKNVPQQEDKYRTSDWFKPLHEAGIKTMYDIFRIAYYLSKEGVNLKQLKYQYNLKNWLKNDPFGVESVPYLKKYEVLKEGENAKLLDAFIRASLENAR